MEISYGNGKTEFGPGVSIKLDGDELTKAINAWLAWEGVYIDGPRTISINDGQKCEDAEIYVDPSGVVQSDGERFFGRGKLSK